MPYFDGKGRRLFRIPGDPLDLKRAALRPDETQLRALPPSEAQGAPGREPLFGGGQGRTPDDVEAQARASLVTAALAVVAVLVLAAALVVAYLRGIP